MSSGGFVLQLNVANQWNPPVNITVYTSFKCSTQQFILPPTMAKSAVYHRQGLKLAYHEAQIQEAVTGVCEGKYCSVAHACHELKLVNFYATVNQQYHGRTKPCINAHTRQQLLNSTQEKVLHNWIKFLGSIGISLLKRTI